MTAASETSTPDALARATKVVDAGIRACEAYRREDLVARLAAAKRSLADPVIHIVVAGEFKQGKSSLINALVGVAVCPVDDDLATAVPTYVRYGEQPQAELLYEGDPPRREPIDLDKIRHYVVESAEVTHPESGDRLIGVEIRLPRKLLAGGLVLVDTPGAGGLRSAHAAASLAAISMADAVLFVTSAAQELTRSERDFLLRAREMCPSVTCVLTKTDFYPAWRNIRDLDGQHLRNLPAGPELPLLAVSSRLRSRAVAANDSALNAESGFPDLVRLVTERVGGGVVARLAAQAAAEVLAVCQQLAAQFQAERTALADPVAAQRVVAELTAVKERVETLRSSAAKWNQTLSDGVADLSSDIEHDLRGRIRRVIEEADDAIEELDPTDSWSEMESWLEARASHELVATYRKLRRGAIQLSEEVAEHFQEAAGSVLDQLAVTSPLELVSGTRVKHRIDLERMKLGKQAMVALKGAYGGALMFIVLGALTGITLGPIGVGVGLLMGRKSLKEEKERQLRKRQAQAKSAARRYCDEVSFVTGKDCRDTLRRIQRQLRDHYTSLAGELNRSHAEALTNAQAAAQQTKAARQRRLKNIDAELAKLRVLREHAEGVPRT
jgi:gas vesicle protein